MKKLLCRLITSPRVDIYENLALEEYLLGSVKSGEVVLYLWQNNHSIVVGRNQDVFQECQVESFLESHGIIVRRLSGGGAVYHDLGNLNYSFIVSRELFDIQKQINMIKKACYQFGIDVINNKKFDLQVNHCKFSGNAFYFRRNVSLHHGTILVNTDLEKLNYFLRSSLSNQKSRSVQSIRSPVINLSIINPKLTVPLMIHALQDIFQIDYAGQLQMDEPNPMEWYPFLHRYLARDWTYRKEI